MDERQCQRVGLDAVAGLPTFQRAHTGESGFTLIEVLVLVAVVLIIAGTACESLAQRPAQVRSSAVAFAAFVAQARSLAAVTGDATLDGGSGASIGIIRDGDAYVATLYAYRPIPGARYAPLPELNTPPLRLPTAFALKTNAGIVEPPFALFFSPSGHASAQPGFTFGISAPLASEPACPLETGIVIAFSDAVETQLHAISCEMAQLNLDATSVPAPDSAALPERQL